MPKRHEYLNLAKNKRFSVLKFWDASLVNHRKCTFVRARLTIWLIRRYCRRPKALRPVCPHLLPPQGLFKSICSKVLLQTSTFFRQSCDTNLHACRKMPPKQSIDSKL